MGTFEIILFVIFAILAIAIFVFIAKKEKEIKDYDYIIYAAKALIIDAALLSIIYFINGNYFNGTLWLINSAIWVFNVGVWRKTKKNYVLFHVETKQNTESETQKQIVEDIEDKKLKEIYKNLNK